MQVEKASQMPNNKANSNFGLVILVDTETLIL